MTKGKITINSLQAIQTGLKSLNIALELNVNSNAYQAVMNISERDNHLGVQAWSLLNPDAQTSDKTSAG